MITLQRHHICTSSSVIRSSFPPQHATPETERTRSFASIRASRPGRSFFYKETGQKKKSREYLQ